MSEVSLSWDVILEQNLKSEIERVFLSNDAIEDDSYLMKNIARPLGFPVDVIG